MINRTKQISTHILLAALLFLCIPTTAYANSSWHWLTGSPLTVLPFAIAATLLIEILFICLINRIKGMLILRTALVVALANVFSFLFPYAIEGLPTDISPDDIGFFERINYLVDKFPHYIVGTMFLLLTLVVEIPVVYFLLRNKVQSAKRLIISIIAVNTATTILVAIIERVFCSGIWY